MKYPLDVAFLTPGMNFQGNTLEHKSLGGSETAALCMARELATIGHQVRVFSNCEQPGKYEGVTYHPLNDWKAYAQMIPHDVSIVQRLPEAFQGPTNSKLNLLWCHDLAMGRQANTVRGVMWNVDRILVVSDFMREQYQHVYGLPDEAIHTTRNGIELSLFGTPLEEVRDRKKLLYCARPERGLDVLLGAIFPKLLERDKDLYLCLAGYDNTLPHMQVFYSQIDRMISMFKDRVRWLGHLSKADLYKHYRTAGVYVYPTPSPTMPAFAEVSCISAMEAQAAGTPVVSSRRGALPETLALDAGTLVEGEPTSVDYQEKFVEAVLRYVDDDEAWARASEAGKAKAQSLDWAGVAAEWDVLFERLIAERNDNPHRLALHLIRRSDILAAKSVLADLDDPFAKIIKARIGKDWWFTDVEDGYRQEYERIGQTHRPDFDSETNELRFRIVRDRIRESGATRVLDFGCAHGCYAVGLSNALPNVTIQGVDIDKHGIMWAEKFRAERSFHPQNLSFRVSGHDVDLSDQEPFDLLFMGEVVEHLPVPWESVTAIERWVKPGGTVLITVPYGPWEYLSYDSYPYRAHVWEYDFHDLREMFGKKPEFTIDTQPMAVNDVTGEPLGWHIVTYKADHQPCGQIDMVRKLALQRPRQSVSVNMMAGPGAEDTLHWCLRSLRPIADEIVLVDTGMTEEGRRIARQYDLRLVSGPAPLEAGFESPRNEGLKHCHGDWILWIDTDERLLETHNLAKYLRENIFNGYSIRQHHFACDTQFKPDLPVRLFRTRPVNDKSMRWYGMIHEHPELGLNEGPGVSIVLSDVHIAHVGYLMESGRRRRFARNLPLLHRDIQTYPDRILQQHFICRDSMLLATYELQQNGGQVTESVRNHCLKVIDIWRKHFKGRAGYMNADTLSYYSDANRVLGQGFEFKFEFAAGRDGQAPNGPGPQTFRFANMEDLEAELSWRAKEAAGPFASATW